MNIEFHEPVASQQPRVLRFYGFKEITHTGTGVDAKDKDGRWRRLANIGTMKTGMIIYEVPPKVCAELSQHVAPFDGEKPYKFFGLRITE